MYTIVIGDRGEYGRRLVKYLESNFNEPVRIHSFTHPDKLMEFTPETDCYVLGEDFVRQMKELGFDLDHKNKIIISDADRPGCFCRYHAPGLLLEMISDKINEGKKISERKGKKILTAVFSPVFEPGFRQIIMKLMEESDMYLGMEDVGGLSGEEMNMGDLCYYARLREETVIHHVTEMVRQEQGIFYLESPELYFDLLELQEDDYRWFFDRMRENGSFGNLYLGIGCVLLGQKGFLSIPDRLILLDAREDERRHAFCDRLEKALALRRGLAHGQYERIYKEDILYEPVR